VLGERVKSEGSYAALARAITRASRGERAPKEGEPADLIDRRKLHSLVTSGKGAVLTIEDLHALDRYLERYGEGLAYRPLLQRPDLMEALADGGRVTFLLGSKPELERGSVSHWDVLAMAEIQRAVGRSEVSVRFDIETVPLLSGLTETQDALEGHAASNYLEEGGPSLVCLGSSRSNPLAELMLARMFDYPGFATASLADRENLPFGFVWNPSFSDVFPSYFHFPPDEIVAGNARAADEIRGGKASALWTPEKVYLDQVTPRQWGETFGLCLAQRRRGGRVWLLLLGITGAATFVAAKLANRLATRLHDSTDESRPSQVYWGIVRASVAEELKANFFNLRQFEGEEIATQEPISVPGSD
jgi:hypothetical protein